MEWVWEGSDGGEDNAMDGVDDVEQESGVDWVGEVDGAGVSN